MEKELGKEYENKVQRVAFLKDNNDPCKYNFALFGLGESQKHK